MAKFEVKSERIRVCSRWGTSQREGLPLVKTATSNTAMPQKSPRHTDDARTATTQYPQQVPPGRVNLDYRAPAMGM